MYKNNKQYAPGKFVNSSRYLLLAGRCLWFKVSLTVTQRFGPCRILFRFCHLCSALANGDLRLTGFSAPSRQPLVDPLALCQEDILGFLLLAVQIAPRCPPKRHNRYDAYPNASFTFFRASPWQPISQLVIERVLAHPKA